MMATGWASGMGLHRALFFSDREESWRIPPYGLPTPATPWALVAAPQKDGVAKRTCGPDDMTVFV
jgi:hypothetical protein